MDISMLQENISSFAACGNCKKTSCLQILTDTNKKRYWLAENYLIKCSNCKHGKSCYTSKRTVKAERQSYYDVNIRFMQHKEWDTMVLVSFVVHWTCTSYI